LKVILHTVSRAWGASMLIGIFFVLFAIWLMLVGIHNTLKEILREMKQ